MRKRIAAALGFLPSLDAIKLPTHGSRALKSSAVSPVLLTGLVRWWASSSSSLSDSLSDDDDDVDDDDDCCLDLLRHLAGVDLGAASGFCWTFCFLVGEVMMTISSSESFWG